MRVTRTDVDGQTMTTLPSFSLLSTKKQWKKRSERRKHCARAGCSKVRTPPARCHKPTDRTDYNTLRRN